MQMPHNAWYAVAMPGEISTQAILSREVLGTRVALYRLPGGTPAAIRDRCPHRFAPLSRGTVIDGQIECKYHGLRFDGDGRCVLNPHADVIAPNAHIASFPVREGYGLVWIWMGDAEVAAKTALPDLAFLAETPERRTIFNYIHAQYRPDILIDNLLDLSHADYLHVGSFSSGPGEETLFNVWDEDNSVVIERVQLRAPTPPIARSHFGQRCNVTMRFSWQPGNAISYAVTTQSLDEDSPMTELVEFAHIVTPANERSGHYFMAVTRPVDGIGPPIELRAASQLRVICEEDTPMLEAIDAEMAGADLMAMRPLVLPTDAAGLRVRRAIKRLVDAESARPATLSA